MRKMDDEKFPARLRKLRNCAGMSRSELAGKARIGTTTIQSYERGIVDPSAHALRCLADALGVSMDYLYGRGK